jgi:hypothetical protein
VFTVAGSRVRRFKIDRPDYPTGEVALYGRIEPDHSPRLPESAITKLWGEIKAVDALVAWFKVRMLFREWDYHRGQRLWLDEVKTKRPALYRQLSTQDRRSAAGRRPARLRFDDAIVKCLNTHGPLGGRVWVRDDGGNRTEWKLDGIEEMMDAIDDLRIWMSPGLTAHSMFNARDARLGKKLSGDLDAPLRRVDIAISRGGYAGGVNEAPNLYSVLAQTLHYSQVLGIEYRQCAAPKCGTLFIAKRSDHYLCSVACRRAISTLRKKAKQQR